MSSRSLEGLTDFRKSDFQKPQDADKPLHEGKQFNEGCVQSSPFCIDTGSVDCSRFSIGRFYHKLSLYSIPNIN